MEHNEDTHGPLMLSVPEAARRIGVGETTAWSLVSDGELLTVKIGRRTLVPVASVDRYVARLVAAAVAADPRAEDPLSVA